MSEAVIIHIVYGGGILLAAYRGADSAELHRRCVTGATVHSLELLDRVPAAVLADLESAEFASEDDDTPVERSRTSTLQGTVIAPITVDDIEDP